MHKLTGIVLLRSQIFGRHVERVDQVSPVPYPKPGGVEVHQAPLTDEMSKLESQAVRRVSVDTYLVEVCAEGLGMLVDGIELLQRSELRAGERDTRPSRIDMIPDGRVTLH